MEPLTGRRREDDVVAPYELEPGDYVKWHLTNDKDEHYDMWYVRAPVGAPFFLASPQHPDRAGRHHHIEEHEDGTVTIEPQEGNSNSIMAPGQVWHGYIRHGVWEPC